MKLIAPCDAPDFEFEDINGELLKLSGFRGKPVILSFFRDAACPFCWSREDEYSRRFKQWKELGIEVVAIFSSTQGELREVVSQQPRPFRVLADPQQKLYDQYGLNHSFIGLIWALLFKLPQVCVGIVKGGRLDLKKPNVTLMPADFLIGFDGQIVDLWYARDVADHMPMRRIRRFVKQVKRVTTEAMPGSLTLVNSVKGSTAHEIVAQNAPQQAAKVYT